MAEEVLCPECQSPRPSLETTCPTCGAPPIQASDQRHSEQEEVRTQDLEPYVTLRYIARLFKVLAVLHLIMTIAQVVYGLATRQAGPLADIISQLTLTLMASGFLWAGGDLTLLVIDAGHDLRVSRILLGRINAELHRRAGETNKKA